MESDATLLTSGEASVPSTLEYDGEPSQENVTFTEKEERFSQPSIFVLTTNLPASIDALSLEFTQVRRDVIVFRLHSIAVCHRTVRRVCARPSNHVREKPPTALRDRHPLRQMRRADAVYSFIGAVAAQNGIDRSNGF